MSLEEWYWRTVLRDVLIVGTLVAVYAFVLAVVIWSWVKRW